MAETDATIEKTTTAKSSLTLSTVEVSGQNKAVLAASADELIFAELDDEPKKKSKSKSKDSKTAEIPANALLYGGGVAALFWLAAVAAYQMGYAGLEGIWALTPTQWVGLAVVAFAPVVFMVLSSTMAYIALESKREARRLRAATARLLAPADTATDATRTLAASVQAELDALETGLGQIMGRFEKLDDTLARRVDKLRKSGLEAKLNTQDMAEVLKSERESLQDLSSSLNSQAQGIAEAIAAQSKMVADASKLADAQMQESTNRLSIHTKALNTATDSLGKQTNATSQDLHSKTHALKDSVQLISDEHAQLAELIKQLAEHQISFSTAADNASTSTKTAVEATQEGTKAIQDTIEAVVAQASKLKDMAERERDISESHMRSALNELEGLNEKARSSLSEIKETANTHTEQARQKIEQLGEATFELAERSDKAIEHQLDEARRMVERSSVVVDEAASRLTKGLEDGLSGATARLDQIEGDIRDMLSRMDGLPSGVEQHATAIREALAGSLRDIHATAREAAQDAQAFEDIFEGRIRAHTDAMNTLLGQLGMPITPPPMPPSLEPVAEKPAQAKAPAVPPIPMVPKTATQSTTTAEPANTPPVDIAAPENNPTAGIDTHAEQEPSAMDAPTAEDSEQTPDGDGWTWKGLLASLDTSGKTPQTAAAHTVEGSDTTHMPSAAPVDEKQTLAPESKSPTKAPQTQAAPETTNHETYTKQVFAALADLDIKPDAALPNELLIDVRDALLQNGQDDAMNLTRHMAPASIRKTGNYLEQDSEFKTQAIQFVETYSADIDAAIKGQDENTTPVADVSKLVISDTGRIYLILGSALMATVNT